MPNRRMILVAVAAVLAALLSACAFQPMAPGAPGTQAGRPAAPAAGGPSVDPGGRVVVAFLSPTTHPNPQTQRLGVALANAARLALEDAGDPRLELVFHDTAGDPATAAAAAGAALGQGATLILGPLFGNASAEVAKVAAPREVAVISFSTDAAIEGEGVYLSGYLPEAEVERVLRHAAGAGARSLGVFAPEGPYGEAALRGVREAAGPAGISVVAETSYQRSFAGIQSAAAGFASQARDAGATAILLPDGGEGLRSVGAFMDYHGLVPGQVLYLGLGQWNAAATLQEPALRGGRFPAPDPGAMQLFASRYAARFGEQPPVLATLGYDAVAMAAALLADARAQGARQPFGPGAIERSQGFQGALGPFRFRADGRAERALAILEVGQGGFLPVEPATLGAAGS